VALAAAAAGSHDVPAAAARPTIVRCARLRTRAQVVAAGKLSGRSPSADDLTSRDAAFTF
jgi:hypothetical protein